MLRGLSLTMLLAVCCGCSTQGPQLVRELTVPIDGARALEVDLRFDHGHLGLRVGELTFVEGSVTYDGDEPTPDLEYALENGKGSLAIQRGDGGQEWDLTLCEDIPTDLQIDLGAGEALLDFRRLTMASLETQIGVGSLELDLRRRWEESVEVNLEHGIGSVKVMLPRGVPTVIEVDQGLGSIEAPGFEQQGNVYTHGDEESPQKLRIFIELGIGGIELILSDDVEEPDVLSWSYQVNRKPA